VETKKPPLQDSGGSGVRENGQFTIKQALGIQSITRPPQGFVRNNKAWKADQYILYASAHHTGICVHLL
jgi:hypothetical protein